MSIPGLTDAIFVFVTEVLTDGIRHFVYICPGRHMMWHGNTYVLYCQLKVLAFCDGNHKCH